ncbi:MAG: hypothetical protein LBJ93_01870 [Clostridiales bacterium]|nr:hypothetical protein [Clostridiales bacterium]
MQSRRRKPIPVIGETTFEQMKLSIQKFLKFKLIGNTSAPYRVPGIDVTTEDDDEINAVSNVTHPGMNLIIHDTGVIFSHLINSGYSDFNLKRMIDSSEFIRQRSIEIETSSLELSPVDTKSLGIGYTQQCLDFFIGLYVISLGERQYTEYRTTDLFKLINYDCIIYRLTEAIFSLPFPLHEDGILTDFGFDFFYLLYEKIDFFTFELYIPMQHYREYYVKKKKNQMRVLQELEKKLITALHAETHLEIKCAEEEGNSEKLRKELGAIFIAVSNVRLSIEKVIYTPQTPIDLNLGLTPSSVLTSIDSVQSVMDTCNLIESFCDPLYKKISEIFEAELELISHVGVLRCTYSVEDSLATKLRVLSKRLTELQNADDANKEQLKYLSTQNSELISELESRLSKIEELEHELETAVSETRGLTDECELLKTREVKSQQETQDLSKRNLELERLNAELSACEEKMREDLHKSRETIDELGQEIQRISLVVVEESEKKSKLRENLSTQRQEISRLTQRLKILEEEINQRPPALIAHLQNVREKNKRLLEELDAIPTSRKDTTLLKLSRKISRDRSALARSLPEEQEDIEKIEDSIIAEHSIERRLYEKKIKAYESRIEQLELIDRDLNRKLAEIKRDHSKLATEYESTKFTRESVKSEFEKLRKAISELNSRLEAERKNHAEILDRAAESKMRESEQSKKTISDLETRLKIELETSSRSKGEIENLKAELQEFREINQRLESCSGVKAKEYESLNQTVAVLRSKIEVLQAERVTHVKDIKSAREDLARREKDLAQANSTIQNLTTQLDDLTARLKDNSQESSATKKTLKEKESKLSSLKENLDKILHEIDELRDREKELRESNDKQTLELKTYQDSLEELNSKIVSVTEAAMERSEIIKTQLNQIKKLEGELEGTRTEIIDTQNREKSLKDRLEEQRVVAGDACTLKEQLTAENKQLIAEMEDLRSEQQGIQENIKRRETEVREREIKFQEDLERTRLDLNTAREENSAQQEELQSLRERLRQQNDEMEQKSTEITSLETQFSERAGIYQQDISEKTVELEKIEKGLESSNQKIMELYKKERLIGGSTATIFASSCIIFGSLSINIANLSAICVAVSCGAMGSIAIIGALIAVFAIFNLRKRSVERQSVRE